MTTGFVYYRAQGDQVLLRRLVGTHEAALSWVMDERVDDDRFVRLADWADRRPWQQGCCFGPRVEIRWRAAGPDSYDLWLLSEDAGLALDGDWQCKQFSVGSRSTMYLWGAWRTLHAPGGSKQTWIETRIPRPLPYPIIPRQEGTQAVLSVVEYSEQGMVRFTRMCDLSVVEPPVEALR